jgi:signal transduction histidine kinase
VKRKSYFFIIQLLAFWLFPMGVHAQSFYELGKNSIYLLEKDEWLFYPGKTYQEIKENPALVPEKVIIPGNWVQTGHSAFGYGTYLYKFTHDLKPKDHLSIKVMTIGTSYDFFANGELVGSTGVFSKTKEGYKPDYYPRLFNIEAKTDTVELAFQVANYDYRNGGIWFAPSIGLPEKMLSLQIKELFTDSFLCGSLFVLFCYFIAFYYIKTDDKSSLYFAAMCFFAALRIASTGDILLRQLPFHIPWDLLVKSEYISMVMMLLFGVFYMNSLFPRDVNKKMVKYVSIIQLSMALLFFVLPISIGSYIIPYYLFFCAFLLVYLLNLVVKVVYMKRPLSYLVGGAFALVFVAGINDILYSQAIIRSIYLMPPAIFLFAIVQAITLTRLFSMAFNEVESLSNKLKNINLNQKEIIQERTSLLNMQAQELQRSNQIKDKVFSIIAHDLRAPIKSLSTVLAWVADDDLTFDELKKSLGSISKNVDTLNLTLENLLQWSRSQLNGVKSEPELIDIRRPLQEIMDLYKIQLNEKSIHFKLSATERHAVFIDKHHLNLLLRNLVSNAIKFTKPEGVIEVTAEPSGGGNTKVCIKDDGVGMSEEAIQKVFSPVEHYTTYGTGNEKGTGLGLLLCKEYVDGGRGEIWIESQVGEGTKVCFTLPSHAI